MMQEDSNGDFEIVDKKMTSLLVSDGSTGSSVLTNVAPPSALPSFLTSPLPPASGTSHPPGTTPIPPPGSTPIPSPGSTPIPPRGSTPIPPRGSTPIPSPGSTPIPHRGSTPIPPRGSTPIPSPGSTPIPPRGTTPLPPGTSMAPPGPGLYSMTSTGPGGNKGPPPSQAPPLAPLSGPSPSPPASPTLGHPSYPVLAGATSSPPPQASFVSQPPTPTPVTSQPQPPSSDVDACASVDLGSPGVESPPGRGWLGWIRGTVSNVGHRVAERAKTSMDTMITTLDPQMKEFIYSGGDVDIVVASDKEVKVGAVREAFQIMFGKATVSGVAAQAEGVAAQPVGFEGALKSAEERINFLRSSGRIHPQQPIVAVENFIVELTPDSWFDIGLLLIDDPGEDILLQTYTQVTPVPLNFVNQARSSTPDDYPYKNTGFATTVGQIASQHLQVHHTLWQETLTGVARRELIVLAARALAGLYRARLSRPH